MGGDRAARSRRLPLPGPPAGSIIASASSLWSLVGPSVVKTWRLLPPEPHALGRLAAAGTKVVVTVDCGICSCAEADEARRLGLELIVTDHHEHKADLPCADVLVHPRLPGHAYPFGGLSGAGVAFKVAWLVCQRAEGGERVGPRLREV